MATPTQLTLTVLRPDDLVALSVRTVNLRVDAARPSQPRLVREDPGQAAYLVVTFPPQSIAEQAFFEATQVKQPGFNPPPSTPPLPAPAPLPAASDTLVPPGSAAALMAGESRLVFRLPAAVAAIDYSVTGLLDWDRLELVLPPAARVPPGGTSPKPAIAAPTDLETSLELPFRLMMAPNVMPGDTQPGWQHAAAPVLHAARAELWHTRLGSRRAGSPATFTEAAAASPVPLRAVWSPDYVPGGPLPGADTPFTVAMSPSDRDQIVILTAAFDGYTLSDVSGERPYIPMPVNASRLFLSALGGWLTARGSWSYPVSSQPRPDPRPSPRTGPRPAAAVAAPPVVPLDLAEWDHLATQGRDHYVRIVYEGYLYPFGHRASLIKVTERKVLAPNGTAGNPADSPVAYLRQSMYIPVRERDKDYTGAPYQFDGREMPLASLVRINTLVTPEIDEPPVNATSFWINVGGEPFQFHVTARDLAGQEFTFLAPMIFVSLSETNLDEVVTAYTADAPTRRCATRGQKVAYADPSAGDTQLKTGALYFTGQLTGEAAPYPVAPFLPVLDRAEVTVPSLAEIIGRRLAVLIQLYPAYLASGLDPHAGVFAEITDDQPDVAFSADKAGGFAQPDVTVTAVSARKGLIAGAASDAAAGNINPAAYFGASSAKLFGVIPLSGLIPVDPQTLVASAALNAPTIRTKAKPDAAHPTHLTTVMTWQPEVTSFDGSKHSPSVPVSIDFNSGGTSALDLKVTIESYLNGRSSTSTATCTLTNFLLHLVGIVDVQVAEIRFTSKNAAKSTVALDLAEHSPISFDGPLRFVQTLASILPPGLFGGGGPSIKATKTDLEVSYTLALPPISCGVFTLQNIAVTAGLDLPYVDGKPAVEFGFASRSKPFLLTVEIFGGGGFIHLIIGADGVRMVEGALEFGGNFAFDIGVASGGVHAMAGIYFQLKGTTSDLTGFIDLGGEVSVLGIVSISLDLNLSLSWKHSTSGNVIEGRATLTVSVHVLFFSASVQLSMERSFSAGGADPGVGQLVTASQWSDYAKAFA